MQTLPDYREIELTLSRQNVVDQIGALLYALNIVQDNEHIVGIDFIAGDNTVPMTVKIKRHQEVEVIRH